VRVLALILLLFEPFLAATLLLRVGPTLLDRDGATMVAFAVRVALALGSVAAAIGLRAERPYGRPLAAMILVASAAFAIVQSLTRALPTSLEPALLRLVTIAIVIHHAGWLAVLVLQRRPR
jgi:hypothetical protein